MFLAKLVAFTATKSNIAKYQSRGGMSKVLNNPWNTMKMVIIKWRKPGFKRFSFFV